ncbi:efflux RND transporter permease subunit [Deltaproteobacteria bacterium TL4]
MRKITEQIEHKFEIWARFVYHRHWSILIGSLLITAALYTQLPKLTIDSTMEGFFHKDDPVLLHYNELREQFGRDDIIAIAIQPPTVFDLNFLKKLKLLHKEIEATVPHLEKVTSLINARTMRGENDKLIVEELMKKLPTNEMELMALKKKIFSTLPYLGVLISKDGTMTNINVRISAFTADKEVLQEDKEIFQEEEEEMEDEEKPKFVEPSPQKYQFIKPEENAQVVHALRDIIKKYEAPDFKVYMAGPTIYARALRESMEENLPLFTGLSVLVIGIFVFALLRRLSGPLISLLVVILALFGTLSLLPIFGIPFTIVTQILPSFLLTVGIGDSVHILTVFYKCYSHGDSREEAIVYAIGHSGIPVVMTSLTTAGGLWSFAGAEIAPVADLGMVGGFGVIMALLYTLVLLPALLSIIPVKKKGWFEKDDLNAGPTQKILSSIGNLVVRRPVTILIVFLGFAVVSFLAAMQLRFTHQPLKWFPKDAPFRVSTEKIDGLMAGTLSLEIVVDTQKLNGLNEPEIMNKLEQLSHDIKQLKFLTGGQPAQTLSIADILKEIHQALNNNDAEFYKIPQDRKLVTQELFLFESSGSDDLKSLIDEQHTKARFTIFTPNLDAMDYVHFTKEVRDLFEGTFGREVTITITGVANLVALTAVSVIHSMAISYVISFGVITCLMILFLGKFKIGLLSMIPNIIPIVFIIGFMAVFDYPLDMFTILIGSIAIGLVVDDTIHFLHGFHRYLDQADNYHYAIHSTLQYTGRAMLFTSLILSSGFAVFTISEWSNLSNFGLLSAICIMVALLADVYLTPTLMRLYYRDKG